MDPRIAGGIGAALTAVPVLMFPVVAVPLLAGLLWLTVGLYIGMALMQSRQEIRAQAIGGAGTLLLALLGATVDPRFLVAGWLTHPAWDLLHHRGIIRTAIHPATVPFCIVYDVLVAALAAWVAFAN